MTSSQKPLLHHLREVDHPNAKLIVSVHEGLRKATEGLLGHPDPTVTKLAKNVLRELEKVESIEAEAHPEVVKKALDEIGDDEEFIRYLSHVSALGKALDEAKLVKERINLRRQAILEELLEKQEEILRRAFQDVMGGDVYRAPRRFAKARTDALGLARKVKGEIGKLVASSVFYDRLLAFMLLSTAMQHAEVIKKIHNRMKQR